MLLQDSTVFLLCNVLCVVFLKTFYYNNIFFAGSFYLEKISNWSVLRSNFVMFWGFFNR